MSELHVIPTLEELRNVTSLPVFSAELLTGGRLNTICKLTLAGEPSSIVLRISKHRSAESVVREIQFHCFLNRMGVASPQVIPLPDGQLLFFVGCNTTGDKYPAFLLEHINGHIPVQNHDLTKLGQALASLHQWPCAEFIQSPSGFNLSDLKKREIPHEFTQVTDLNRDVLIAELENDKDHLEKGLCHGDPFPQNVIIRANQAYLIDLENMGWGDTLLDLGMGLFGAVTGNTDRIDAEKVEAFLTGYQSVKPLSPKQISLLPIVTALAGWKIAHWRYQYEKANPHSDVAGRWAEALQAAAAWKMHK